MTVSHISSITYISILYISIFGNSIKHFVVTEWKSCQTVLKYYLSLIIKKIIKHKLLYKLLKGTINKTMYQ